MEQQKEGGIEAGTRAYAKISAHLESWTVGTNSGSTPSSSNWRTYEEDSVNWLHSVGSKRGLSQSKHTQAATLVDTPVMSNSTVKGPDEISPFQLPQGISEENNDFDADSIPPDEFRRYHVALWSLLQGRKAAIGQSQEDKSAERLDYEFLAMLASEHEVWGLLSILRKQGLSSLLRDDSDAAIGRENKLVEDWISQLPNLTTQHELFNNLCSETAPNVLQRRSAILHWVQKCYESSLPSMRTALDSTMWTNSLRKVKQGSALPGSVHPDAPLLIPEESMRDAFEDDRKNDQFLLKQCFGFILAGRADKAAQMCLDYGQPWRSSAWSGSITLQLQKLSAASQFKSSSHALWKKQCSKLAATLEGNEAAIYAFFSSDVRLALEKPEFRAWEPAFLMCFHSMVDLQISDILHEHLRRLQDNGFGGYKQSDNKGPSARAVFSGGSEPLQESTIVSMLKSSPFENVRNPDFFQKASGAFIVGRTAVSDFLTHELKKSDLKMKELQFACHLLVFLDHVGKSSQGVVALDVDSDLKTTLLLKYLRHLVLHPDLWCLMTLYASLLPETIMLREFACLLIKVDVDSQRALILSQINDTFEPRVAGALLRRVVDIVVDSSSFAPCKKVKALDWFFLSTSHSEEALASSNRLIRQLLMVEDHDPAMTMLLTQRDKLQRAQSWSKVGRGWVESTSYLELLEAQNAFDKWKRTVAMSSSEAFPAQIPAEALQNFREKSNRAVSAATTAYQKLFKVLTTDGGFLVEDEEEEVSDQVLSNETRQKDLRLLRSKYVPQLVFMLHNVCDEMGKLLYGSILELVPGIAVSPSHALKLSHDCIMSDDLPPSPGYWIRRARWLAVTSGAEEFKIHDALTVAQCKDLCKRIASTVKAGLEFA